MENVEFGIKVREKDISAKGTRYFQAKALAGQTTVHKHNMQ